MLTEMFAAAKAGQEKTTMLSAGPHFFSAGLNDNAGKILPSATTGSDPISQALAAHGDTFKPKAIKSNKFFGLNSSW